MDVYLVAALTIDGFIARTTDQVSTKWTSKEDTKFYVSKIKETGVVVMGSTTFASQPKFTTKNVEYVVQTRSPEQFVAPEGVSAWATDASPDKILVKIAQKGYSKVVIAGGASTYTRWMQSGLVTDMFLTTEPVVFGSGVGLFTQSLDLEPRKIELIDTTVLSPQTRVSHYKIL